MVINYRNNKKGLFGILFILVFFFSCKKLDFNKISTAGTWNPNIAVPLAFGEFGVYDILARTDSTDLVVIDPETGKIALVYRGDLFAIEAKDIIQLQDVSEEYGIDVNDLGIPPSPSFSGTVSETISETFIIDTDTDTEIHEVTYSQGQLRLTVNSTFNHNVNATVVFPTMLKNGAPVEFELNLTGASNEVNTIDLEGVVVDFTVNGTTTNTFEVVSEIEVTGTGGPISGNERIDVDLELLNIDFLSVFGYYGQVGKPIQDSILLRVFEEVRDGFFQFTDPKVYLELQSSFGIPMNVDLDELKTIVTQTGEDLPLQGYPTPIQVNSPSNLGEIATTLIQLDKTNTSNIETIVTPTPKFFYYDATVNLNPMGPTNNLNFVKNTSELILKSEVELPLEGFAYGFSLRDTFDFDVGTDLEEADAIDYVMFRLNIDNGFPVDIDAQVVFMDENYNTVFTAFDDQEDIALSALTDNTGKVTQSTKKITDILLDRDKIELLDQVVYFELIGFGETKNGPAEEIVKIFDDYKINMRLGVQIEGRQSF